MDALLTDLYQLTMAYGYWQQGRAEDEAAFHLFFRAHPFGGGYTVCAGLASVVAFLRDFHFTDADIDYLATLTGNDDAPLFAPGFLEYLRTLRLSVDVDAMPEGTVVFPHEPLLRVTGPLLQAQLLETPLLNNVNFETLIATKAARIARAATRCSSSACAGRRGSTAPSPPAGRPTWAGARRPRTSSPGVASAFRWPGPTRTAG